MTISATLTGRPDQYGRKRIYIRIAQGNDRQYKATEMRVLPSQFKEGKVIGLPNAKAYNEKIKALIRTVEHDQLFMSNGVENFDIKLSDFIQECMRKWSKSKREGTMRQNMTEFRKLMEFAGPDIKLSMINVDFLNDYLEYCYSQGNTVNTAWKTFKFVRKVMLRAYKEKKRKDYPFDLFEMPKYTDPQRDYLTDEEVNAIHKIAENKKASAEIRFVANWFLISCYTALRFSDWQQFSKSHIVNNRLVLYTTKTTEVVSMPLVDKVRKLFEAVGYKGMHYSNKHVNVLLKDIAAGAGIHKSISAHIARHTFGVRAAHVMSVEACARLMGISVRVCQVYYKVVDKVSDREYEKLFS
jgi:site-specific recombinase XerD